VDDGLVYIVVMTDELFGLRAQLRVFKTWEAADQQAKETARDQRKYCWVIGFPDPRLEENHATAA